MRPILPFLLLAVAFPGPTANAQRPTEHTYGISLNVGMNNELFTCFIVKLVDGKVAGTEPLTREQFVLQAQGKVPGKGNPEGVNLFAQHGVEACTAEPHEDGTPRYMWDCPALDLLWKLRWFEFPFHTMGGQSPGMGWAGRPASPSEGQMGILAGYGLDRVGGLIHGDALFRLLRDMGDPAWVDRYRNT